MQELIDIADLDVIYLTYDEPKREEFWIQIQNMVPWAQRVDGVKGSDAAHKAAADASTTDRFVLVDGDNIPDPAFFNLQLDAKINPRGVLRYRARNNINGLMYGNGGLSIWHRDFVYNMRTHENTDGSDENSVEFCFHPDYWAMHDCYSTTYPDATAFQAWRAGFREGVKMCLDRGAKPSIAEFKTRVVARNMDNLSIWHNVGADNEMGIWAMAGARQGTYNTMLTDWDYREVQDFAMLTQYWEETVQHFNPVNFVHNYEEELTQRLGLPIVNLDAEQSQFFKHHYKSNFKNTGAMVRE
jgi:hypothetical protein